MERPLGGLRVLDLARVLAGPVAPRFLAAFGAEVLRIDPPHWDEPAVVPEVTLGKRCARLDLRAPDGRSTFTDLLRNADVLAADAAHRTFRSPRDDEWSMAPERTDSGTARRLKAPLTVEGTPMHWDRPATRLGRSSAAWSPAP